MQGSPLYSLPPTDFHDLFPGRSLPFCSHLSHPSLTEPREQEPQSSRKPVGSRDDLTPLPEGHLQSSRYKCRHIFYGSELNTFITKCNSMFQSLLLFFGIFPPIRSLAGRGKPKQPLRIHAISFFLRELCSSAEMSTRVACAEKDAKRCINGVAIPWEEGMKFNDKAGRTSEGMKGIQLRQ